MSTPKADWIWFNGEFVPWDEANVHVTTHALHYGSSVFEGIRAYSTPMGPAILGLDLHMRRLFDYGYRRVLDGQAWQVMDLEKNRVVEQQ